jgi:hypothetical protein
MIFAKVFNFEQTHALLIWLDKEVGYQRGRWGCAVRSWGIQIGIPG